MFDIESYISELRSKASLLIYRLESVYHLKGLDLKKSGLYKLLRIILEDLEAGRITPERLRGNDFGIFRIVTDGWLEDSEIGQDVLEFGSELRQLADMLEQSGNSER